VTVTSKILGSIPVLGIIVISKTLLRNLIDENDFSYLNLKRILNASYSGQTHHTPAIPQILDFYEKLKNFDTDKMKDNINANCEILLDAIGEDNVIGEKYCPVITIKKEYLPKVISEKYQLYGHWSKGYVQIFTYSEQRKDYESLAYDIKKAR